MSFYGIINNEVLMMLTKIKKFITENELFQENTPIVIALSGGVDSSVLLDVLRKLNYQVIIAHVNHHKRLESEMEEKAIRNYATKNHIPFEVLEYEHNDDTNFHADAHKARYDFYMNVAKKYNTKIIVTAHHQNDNAETILMNIMSGSNLYGYAGIAPKLEKEGLIITRPLLCCTKGEILDYANENSIVYYEDSSNSENHYERNRIRHFVVPTLEKEYPEMLSKMSEYSEILKESFDFIRLWSINYLEKLQNKIDIPSYSQLNKALRHDIICLLLEKYEINKTLNIIHNIDDILLDKDPQKEINLQSNYIFKKRYNYGMIEKESQVNQFSYTLKLDEKLIIDENRSFLLTKNISTINAKYIKLCYNKLIFPLIVRSRQSGDIIEMPYGHKKVKDLLIDKKVEKEIRDNLAIVTDGENNILWVVDYAKSKSVFEQKENSDLYLIYEVK